MKFAKKSDVILILAIAAAGLLLWVYFGGFFGRSEGLRAEIYHNSSLVRVVDLTGGNEESFSIEGEAGVVFHLYADGSIAFAESDCRDKVCVKTGRLRSAGQTAACLPKRIYVKIVGGEEGEPDIVIG